VFGDLSAELGAYGATIGDFPRHIKQEDAEIRGQGSGCRGEGSTTVGGPRLDASDQVYQVQLVLLVKLVLLAAY
jgi:hypothetical protein